MARVFRDARYKPIADYAVIGNLRTAALVGLDGAIDWCCFPFLDSPSNFGAILDADKGGTFRICPAQGQFSTKQRYLEHTNVVSTMMFNEQGCFELIDCMPVRGDLEHCDYRDSDASVHRLIRGVQGSIEVELLWAPRFDYARSPTRFERVSNGVAATDGLQTMTLGGVPGILTEEITPFGPQIRASFIIEEGDEIAIVTRWASSDAQTSVEDTKAVIDEACLAWRRWVNKPSLAGERQWGDSHKELVIRSELALKLMAQGDTGALAAAVTTSLPETIGGVRNWDYRYAWIRDAAQTARAFFALGHTLELDRFIQWAEGISLQHGQEQGELAIMYSLRPDTALYEEELTHLEGYRGSSPVRIGNLASEQLQLDIYGELIGAIHEQARLKERFDRNVGPFIKEVANQAAYRWQEADFSIWEPRNGPAQFVYSKMMVWVALQRATELHNRGLLAGNDHLWRSTKIDIRNWIDAHGYSDKLQSFVQIAGGHDLDAANLLMPIYGYLPVDDPRVQNTINRTLLDLTDQDLVYRYHAPDGLPGQEGAFVLCTFWLVDALTLSGRLDEAHRVFENLVARANHVGLLAEQIDPSTGEFLGNFPQAYSHIGIINSTIYFAAAEGRPTPARHGAHQER